MRNGQKEGGYHPSRRTRGLQITSLGLSALLATQIFDNINNPHTAIEYGVAAGVAGVTGLGVKAFELGRESRYRQLTEKEMTQGQDITIAQVPPEEAAQEIELQASKTVSLE